MNPLESMLTNVIIFVLLAIPGYLLVKTKILKSKESAALSKLLTYVGMPFMILLNTLNVEFTAEVTKSIILIAVLGIVFIVATFFVSAYLVIRGDEAKKQGMMRFCMVFANSGFLGLPLAAAVFKDQPLVTIYLSILNIITNVLMFTLGVYLISGDKEAISLKKALLSPVLIAFVVGIVLNLTKVAVKVPDILTYSRYFNNIVPPISMTILGVKMADVNMTALFKKWQTYFVSAMKLVVFPAVGLAILFALRTFMNMSDEMILGFFIAFATPTAGLASTFSDQYDGDTENAVAFTLGTTLLSVATIPTLYWLLTMIL